ncbi:MAG: L-threonylcarbamoyladenylate synthase [Leptospiraceae bacterium]|nr:L-threonylcarbamoyladenylate synthase [Leptospiraceae bacterium]
MILELHPKNPEERILKKISSDLKAGEVYILPTDTVYALVADSMSKTGVEKLYSLKKLEKSKPLSLLCKDISVASEYIESLPNHAFKLMKRITPGPYTFIFKANRKLPRVTLTNEKSKSIGIRIPDLILIQELLRIHSGTLVSTSVFTNDEYITDIEDLEKMFGSSVSGIVNGGIIKVELSTILDFYSGDLVVVREGKGKDFL